MKNIKKLSLFIISSLFILTIGNANAKYLDLHILNESHHDMPKGYTLRVQVCREAQTLHNQKMDVSKIPSSQSKWLKLNIDFDQQKLGNNLAANNTCVSLWNDLGQKVAEDKYLWNCKDLDRFPLLQIHLDADKNYASINSIPDRFGMALLEASQPTTH